MIPLLISPARANTSYVVNGSFEVAPLGSGQLGFNTDATGWTNAQNGNTWGYNFLFAPGVADSTGATGSGGNLMLWGPGNGSANGLPASSPDGGNYIAGDGVFQQGAISQLITGLTPTQTYVLGFYWAGAQQQGFDGATTEWWQVTLGTTTQTTAIVNNVSHGFTGWTYQTMSFVANNASETLSFLAGGTPNGVPPFTLLDGVSLVATPEPGTFALIGLGLLVIPIGSLYRRRRP